MLEGIKHFLQFINENWVNIIIIIGLAIALAQKIKSYIKLTKEEKIEIAKAQARQVILTLVTKAEVDYADWTKAGSIKRSQVIAKIYEEFPVLSRVADQEQLTIWIDDIIDEALKTLRPIVKENKEEPNNTAE